ncbi:type ISP restriction/modification enzyme [Pleurocapsa sp. FMAR1]|uniref:type ISP restriction/modification enzyme n=1 Tax=Pleurocapsa sp. FMAR1 TaxID=3040204 RepID=UPI0029C794B1|nr:type ISP restriction/modification enzyme [Pleurocapsa sp. FMAR1]
MRISFKNSQIEIRKHHQRSPEIAKSPRQIATLQRNEIVRPKFSEASSAIKKFSKHSASTVVTYPVPGKNAVEQISYAEPLQDNGKGLVWINSAQYFENVPPSVWNFGVGNYCICQKWLKLREGTTLNRQNVQDYQRLVMLISETINLMNNVNSQLMHE